MLNGELSHSNVKRFLSQCVYTLEDQWEEERTVDSAASEGTAPVFDHTLRSKLSAKKNKTVDPYYNQPRAHLLEAVNGPTYKLKLTPYAKTFHTEWLLKPDSYQYNMLCADQILYGHLDVKKLRAALKRYVGEHLLLNSHIQRDNDKIDELCWVKNPAIDELDYSDTPVNESDLLAYVQRPFDLYSGPLYRFKLVRLSKNEHRFIIVLHHIIMDSISINAGLFEAISNYYNDPSYKAEYSIADQIELITNLEQRLSLNLVQFREAHKKFWQQQLADVDSIDLNFLSAPFASSTDPADLV